ncbi:MAG TPA: hypothetical protein DEA96_09185 [Leptospiraceae bacterium]|nr:hypothetical protein [Spirochaetaceae bacterium]HBS05126.1 hypothetical protein [Leptospiraceae bacterium]
MPESQGPGLFKATSVQIPAANAMKVKTSRRSSTTRIQSPTAGGIQSETTIKSGARINGFRLPVEFRN